MPEPIVEQMPNSPESAARARELLRAHKRLDSMRQTEADLIVTELVANVVTHAPDAPAIHLEFAEDGASGLRVSVMNEANADISGSPKGMGHTVTDRLSRQWGTKFEDGNLTVWFVLRTPGAVTMRPELSDSDLIERIDADPAAVSDELIRRHSDLATNIARRYRGKGIDDDDLDQVARMALLKAIQRFDPSVGDLRPYAAVTISGELKKQLRDEGWSVRVPRSLQEKSMDVLRTIGSLSQTLGRDPTDAEVAEKLGIEADEVAEARRAGKAYTSGSIDKPAEETGIRLADRLAAIDSRFSPEDQATISDAISRLPKRLQHILRLRFEEDMTQSEIGGVVGISQMHVSRLLTRAIDDLRSDLTGAG